MGQLDIRLITGKSILPYIQRLAELRINVFKEYPYLYVGTVAYETEYLAMYSDCEYSVMVLVLDEQQIVGVATAIPMEFAVAEFQQPFVHYAVPIPHIFYLGESVLLPAYRGQGIYKHFFKAREQAGREYGCRLATFCAVDRPGNHPLKPVDYVPLDAVWQHFGYTKQPTLRTYFEWQDLDEPTESKKPMTFWTKNL